MQKSRTPDGGSILQRRVPNVLERCATIDPNQGVLQAQINMHYAVVIFVQRTQAGRHIDGSTLSITLGVREDHLLFQMADAIRFHVW